MGLNTEQGIHVWRHKKDGSVLVKIDGWSYINFRQSSSVDLAAYTRITLSSLSHVEWKTFLRLISIAVAARAEMQERSHD